MMILGIWDHVGRDPAPETNFQILLGLGREDEHEPGKDEGGLRSLRGPVGVSTISNITIPASNCCYTSSMPPDEIGKHLGQYIGPQGSGKEGFGASVRQV